MLEAGEININEMAGLPIEALGEITKRLCVSDLLVLMSSNKVLNATLKHDYIWSEKYSLYFPDEFKEIIQEMDEGKKKVDNFFTLFKRHYKQKFSRLPKEQREFSELVYEGRTDLVREKINACKQFYVRNHEQHLKKLYPEKINLILLTIIKDLPEMAEILLENGYKADTVFSSGRSLLDNAIRNYRADIARLLIMHGAHCNRQNKQNITPLIYAVMQSSVEIVKLLLEQNVILNLHNKAGYTALHYAAESGHLEIVECLLQKGADVNIRTRSESGMTPLHLAVTSCSAEVVKLLIQEGADLNAKSVSGDKQTPFELAIDLMNFDVISGFLSKGVNLLSALSDGKYIIHKAVEQGQVKLLNLLIENKADVNKEDRQKRTPIYYALKALSYECYKILLDNGAISNLVEIDDVTAMEYVFENNHIQLLKLLLSKHTNIERRMQLLAKAASAKNLEVVNLILESNANLKMVEHYYKDILTDCIREKNLEVLTTILDQAGVSPDLVVSSDDNSNLLHIAALRSNALILNALIERGGNIEAETSDMFRPLMLAGVFSNDIEVVQLLIDAGAKLEAQNFQGRTALGIALSSTCLKKAELLLTQGANPCTAFIDDPVAAAHKAAEAEDPRILELILKSIDEPKLLAVNCVKALSVIVSEKKLGCIDVIKQFWRREFLEFDRILEILSLCLNRAIEKHYPAEILNQILWFGANPNSPDVRGNLPINYLLKAKHTQTTQVSEALIDAGIELSSVNDDGETILMLAIRNNNNSLVEVILARGLFDINYQNKLGLTALHIAVYMNNHILVKSILQHKPNLYLKAQDSRKRKVDTVFHYAIRNNEACILTSLLQQPLIPEQRNLYFNLFVTCLLKPKLFSVFREQAKMDFGYTDSEGNNVMHQMIAKNNTKALRDNLNTYYHKSNLGYINLFFKENAAGDTALDIAFANEAFDIILFLAETFKGTKYAVKILILATQKYSLSMLRLILRSGAVDINSTDEKSNTALHHAVMMGDLEKVKLLISFYPDLSITNSESQTVFHSALLLENYAILNQLLSTPAKQLPLHIKTDLVIYLIKLGKLDHLTNLHDYTGLELNSVDATGDSVLHRAIHMQQAGVIRFLVNNLSNLNILDAKRKTPLHLAMEYGEPGVIALLLSKGADCCIKLPTGEFVIENAVANGDHKLVELFLQYTKDVNIYNNLDIPLLHRAAKNNNLEITKQLLANGVKADAIDFSGRTALFYALSYRQILVAKQILGFYPENLTSEQIAELNKLEGTIDEVGDSRTVYSLYVEAKLLQRQHIAASDSLISSMQTMLLINQEQRRIPDEFMQLLYLQLKHDLFEPINNRMQLSLADGIDIYYQNIFVNNYLPAVSDIKLPCLLNKSELRFADRKVLIQAVDLCLFLAYQTNESHYQAKALRLARVFCDKRTTEDDEITSSLAEEYVRCRQIYFGYAVDEIENKRGCMVQ